LMGHVTPSRILRPYGESKKALMPRSKNPFTKGTRHSLQSVKHHKYFNERKKPVIDKELWLNG